MEFTALGGGHEIGRSCYVLRLSGKNLVVDCGFKFGHNRRLLTPDISCLDNKRVDAIFVTHGHLDHIGSLPILAKLHLEAKIFMTSPTKAVCELMLRDTIKIAERNHQTPLFSHEELDGFLDRIQLAEIGEWFTPAGWGPEWQICFWPSGHMCGACSILIKSPEGNAMFSGDISFYNTPVVEGARLPKNFDPYLLVTEATNGDCDLPDRAAEMARLMTKVKEIQKRGGHVLIPAFASERGPNIAMELAKAGIKVRSGGMINDVLKICGLSHPNIVPVRRKRTSADPTGSQAVYEIAKPGAPPAIVVTTTGMMDFGLSNDLAFVWVEDPKNAILIPGYQAEEAFGKKLIQIQHGGYLEFPEMRVSDKNGKCQYLRPKTQKRVLAEVERFHLSGHAGASNMATWITALKPATVVMVHGEKQSFQGLKRELKKLKATKNVLVGENGKTFTNKTL